MNTKRLTVTLVDLRRFIEAADELHWKAENLSKVASMSVQTIEREIERGNYAVSAQFGDKASNELIESFLVLSKQYEDVVFKFMGERIHLYESPFDFIARIASLGWPEILATMARNGIRFKG
jgi:hypothetical protein